jgi:O-acetyl-ADP-ribose deacetylase (regulator of RNase III)
MIEYIKGDATEPISDNKVIIIHCCNTIGAWGAGFVIALSKKWLAPESEYKQWARDGKLKLGEVQFVKVDNDICVGNMIGQYGIGYDKEGNPPIRYKAIQECLKKVYEFCIIDNREVHCPKFGAGLAGGDWDKIEQIIDEELIKKGILVKVYEYE